MTGVFYCLGYLGPWWFRA